jgi:hypothetical protein
MTTSVENADLVVIGAGEFFCGRFTYFAIELWC